MSTRMEMNEYLREINWRELNFGDDPNGNYETNNVPVENRLTKKQFDVVWDTAHANCRTDNINQAQIDIIKQIGK